MRVRVRVRVSEHPRLALHHARPLLGRRLEAHGLEATQVVRELLRPREPLVVELEHPRHRVLG